MTGRGRGIQWFDRVTANPPMWLRVAYLLVFAFLVVWVIQGRGWAIGLVAALVYGGGGLAMALRPRDVVNWSRNHPELDGALLGPLVFLALAVLTHLAIWWCLLGGAVGAIVGAGRGNQRRRRSGSMSA